MSRIDVWNETITEVRKATDDVLNLLMMHSTRKQQIKRNGVHITVCGEQIWYIDPKQALMNLKKEVFVRYDPADLRTMRIYDAEDEKFLFEWGVADILLADYLEEEQQNIADPQGVFDVIARYFGVKEKAKLTYTEVEYAPTNISTQIYDIIGVCQVKGGLATVAGEAGLGKTKAAQKFVEDNPTNSYLITINPCLTNIKSLLKVIADKIGAAQERSRDELWLSIVRKLTDGTVLIFDEAQHLTLKDIEVLRSFSDYFVDKKQTLGICFIGNIRHRRHSEVQ